MTAADRPAFSGLMVILSEVYHRPPSDVVLETYWDALTDYEIEHVAAGVRLWVRTSKWHPTPAELREASSQQRVEARRAALPAGQRALPDRALVHEEIKAFLAELATRRDVAPARSVKRIGDLEQDLARLNALGARDMTDDKARALEAFRRFQAAS